MACNTPQPAPAARPGRATRFGGAPSRPARVRDSRPLVCAVAVLFLALPFSLRALNEYSYDIRLVRALNRIGMYDYAALQIQRMQRRYPKHREELLIERARTLILSGRRREGNRLLASIPASSPVYLRSRLVLAEAAWAGGDVDAAINAYHDYFAKVRKPESNTPEAVEEFRDAVRKYAAALRRKGKSKEAAAVLDLLAALPGENGLNQRQLTLVKNQAVIAAEEQKISNGQKIDAKALRAARDKLESLQWSGVDAVTAAALVEAAHADVLLGEYDRAIRTLQGADEILNKVEEVLNKEGKHDDSPIAPAHFYLGRAFAGKAMKALQAAGKKGGKGKKKGAANRDEARKYLIAAAKHFYFVTKKYPGAACAADALAEFGKVRDILEKEFGKRIRMKGGAAAEAQIKQQQAEAYYRARDFHRALPLFLEATRKAWGTRAFPPAAERTAACFARLGRFLEAEAVASALATVAPKDPHTADALLKLGALLYKRAKSAKDAKERDRLLAQAERVWTQFVTTAVGHEKAPQIAFFLAERVYKQAADLAKQSKSARSRKKKEELKRQARELFRKAAPLYERVTRLFPGSPQGIRSWYKLGWALYSAEERTKAAEAFLKYAHLETDPSRADDRLEAEFRAAECLMFSDAPEKAVPVLEELRRWVSSGSNEGFDPNRPKSRKMAELAANYLGWAWDLAAEKVRPRLTKLRDEQRAAGRRTAELKARLQQIEEYRRSLEKEREQALTAFKEQSKVLRTAASGAKAGAATGAGKAADLDAAEKARRLAAERSKQQRERLAGERIVLEQRKQEIENEIAALSGNRHPSSGEAPLPESVLAARRAWLDAESKAIDANLRANRLLREGKADAAAKACRDAVAAWKSALDAHLRYIGQSMKYWDEQRKAAAAKIAELQRKAAKIIEEITPVEKQFREFKQRAQEAYEAFLKNFPKSSLVPDTMGRLGTVYVELDRYDKAASVLNELAKRFPGSEAVGKAFFQLGRAELELGHIDRAAAAFKRLLKSAKDVPLGNLVYISEKMLEKRPELSLEAAKAILARDETPESGVTDAVRENALFRAGEACFLMKKYGEALKYYQRLLKEFPHTARYFVARLHSGIALREQKPPKYSDALAEFAEVVQFCTDPALVNQAMCEAGRTYERMSGRENLRLALARYQQVALLASKDLEANRPWIELALARSAVVAARLGDADTAREMAARLRREFPESTYLSEVEKALKRMKPQTADRGSGAP